MPVLGLDSGYTVKYTPQPSGGGVYLTVYPSSRPYTDTFSQAFSKDNYEITVDALYLPPSKI